MASEFLKEPNSFDEQAQMYESEISSREYYFERSSSGLYMLNAITKNDIIRFYHVSQQLVYSNLYITNYYYLYGLIKLILVELYSYVWTKQKHVSCVCDI